MKVLVLGAGGREHALQWKISQSPLCNKAYLHPGNGGTRSLGIPNLGHCHSLPEIVAASKDIGISLVVIGPETLLAQGYADEFRTNGFQVVGPSRLAAQLETSKVFAKEFMARADLPTAKFSVVDSETELLKIVKGKLPAVLKLDSLAAGKGVVIARTPSDVDRFTKKIWHEGTFGPPPHHIVIEDYISGNEVSYIGMCDGNTFLPLASATDFKRAKDHDEGDNTGGMGAISPSPYFTQEIETKLQRRIITPLLKQLRGENIDYRGVLYIGLMIDKSNNPYILEFNVRFGDPETQAILPRLESDFVELLQATARGNLETIASPKWKKEVSIYVVGAAEGYPSKVTIGDSIEGFAELEQDALIFYSGVEERHLKLVTSGGRVLGLGVLGETLSSARKRVYELLKQIRWRGMHYRTDIGKLLE